MKIEKEFSNIQMQTKIRTTGTGFITTIPKVVVQLLNLQEEQLICWDIDIKNNAINITLLED